ncbi:protein BANP-like [Centruroides sculpturatus]|uniref:protein BANP-like n=1 Tax=Centruroides sculpturatus TaxID=218467 RepID=UPI000C6EB277|nr:protein BANP-like [Centruroides sculpturatus]
MKYEKLLQRLLLNFNQVVCERLDAIERRLDSINEFCQTLEEKVEMLSSLMKESNNRPFLSSSTSSESINSVDNGSTSVSVGSNFTLITLNSEADYPNGSWLGDESNPDMKVRTHISPTDLFHINTTCHTAEKMALTLLDYLFDRETQACSNISGTGKHKKKQLDPLMIYGIRFLLSRVIQTAHGEIQVLQATPEQIVEIQQTHQIQILNGGHFLATPMDDTNNQLSFKSEALSSFEDTLASSTE